ncbi:glyoxalase [Flavobacterium amnicola]|uniref:Glyoxalase n=1 Tax=Flavobacterium amnicola TaxID=2506422 RepID=A0A4Q1K3M5_9FLAO|nr:glyoxalase [Flavobacterium amnicola]RXR18991.1 glyoxalase [Flavobacterium amnicola]
MESRDSKLLEIRGETLGNVTAQSSSEETFQNQTLRPILKLQNDLFNHVFINYAVKQKNVFFGLTPDKKMAYIENVIQKDIKFRNSLKGMIIAFFTIDEYSEYIKNSSNLNKRMMNLLVERLKSQVQLLEEYSF